MTLPDGLRRRLALLATRVRGIPGRERPHEIAAGCAIGIGVNFVPTLGLGFVLAFLAATLTRVSRTSATATSLITGPLVPVMYGLNLLVGGVIVAPGEGHDNLIAFVSSQYTTILRLGDFKDKFLGVLDIVGTTFLVGAAVNAVLFGFCVYLIVNHALGRSQRRPPQRPFGSL